MYNISFRRYSTTCRTIVPLSGRKWLAASDAILPPYDHLRLRTSGSAILDCSTTVTRPSDEAFQEVTTLLEDWAAGFQGLEKNPKTRENESNWPCDEDEKDKPAQGVDRIGAHDFFVFFL